MVTTSTGRLGIALALLAMGDGCSWKSIVQGPAIPNLGVHPSSSVIEVVDKDGTRSQIAPSTTLRFILRGGDITDDVSAGSLCRNATGVFVADGVDCAHSTPLAAWDDIAAIELEGFDAAATTAVAAVISVAAGVIVLAVLGMGKGGGGIPGLGDGHGGGGGHGGGHGGHVGAHPSVGDGHVAGRAGSAVVQSAGVWDGHATISPDLVVDVSPRVVGGSAELPSPSESPLSTPTPLFTDNARRRSVLLFSLAIDGGTCVYGPSYCSTGAVRGGIRLVDYVELTGGARSMWGWGVADGVARWAPMGGIGFHGSFPRLRQLAFYLGFEAGGGADAIPFFFAGRLGLRYSPIPELAFGLFPFSPTYILEANKPGAPAGLQAPTSLEVSTAF